MTATATTPAGPPGKPLNLTATRGSGNEYSLSWTVPSDGGSAITGYKVEWRDYGTSAWTTFGSSIGTGTPYTGTDSRFANKPIEFRIRATNAQGDGPYSDTATLGLPPAAPTNVVTTLDNAGSTPNQVNLSFTVPADNGLDITGYKVQARFGTSGPWTEFDLGTGIVTAPGATAQTSFVISGVDAQTDQTQFQVRAVNGEGAGAWSGTAIVAGRPSGLGTLTADAASNTVAVNLSWPAPTGTGGKPITQYVVQWRPDATGDWSTHGATGSKPFAGTATGGTVTAADGLQPGTAYNFRYRAHNADRSSFHTPNDGSVEAATLNQATLSIADASVTEGGTMTFTVSLSPAWTEEVRFRWAVSDGTATRPDDYTGATTAIAIASIPVGDSSTTFTVSTVEDALDEFDETFTATISAPVGGLPANVVLGDATATGTIIDNDDPPEIRGSTSDVTEGDAGTTTPMTVTFTLSAPSGKEVRAFATLPGSGETATQNVDYVWQPLSFLAFAPGETSKTFTVTVNGDDTVEPDETVKIVWQMSDATAVSGPGFTATTSTGGQSTGTIVNDDTAPTAIALSVEPARVNEADGATTVTVTAAFPAGSGVPATATNLNISVGAPGDSATEGTDYVTVNVLTLTIPAGMRSAAAPFTLTPTDDPDGEGDESITISATASGGLTVRPATLTLLDDDAPVVSVADARADEGEPVTFKVSISQPVAQDVTVRWATADGAGEAGANAPGDYAAQADGKVTIAARETSATFAVRSVEDDLYEHDETFRVRLSVPSGGLPRSAQGRVLLATDPSATGTIVDDDAPPVLRVVRPSNTEGDGGGSSRALGFWFILDHADGLYREVVTGRTVTVAWATALSTGRDPAEADDFKARSGRLTFAPTRAGRRKAAYVPIVGDTLVEGDETVDLVVSELTHATFDARLSPSGGTARVTGTIENDDAAPTAIGLSVSPRTVREDAGATPVTVTAAYADGGTIAWPTEVAVRVGVRTNRALDATRGTDYTTAGVTPRPLGGGLLTVRIPAGQRSGSAQFTLTPTQDAVVERAFEFIWLRGKAEGYAPLHGAAALLVLIDDDATARLVVTPATITEGGAAARVSARLDRAVAGETTLTVAAAPVSGTDAADFTLTGTTLTIPEGATSSTGTVTLTGNEDADEDHEQVRVSATVSHTGTATVAGPAAVTLRIRDDEAPNTPATGAPTVSGTAQVGQALSAGRGSIADPDGLPADAAFAWQWVRVEPGGAERDIEGATQATYRPVAADLGRRLRVRAAFTDAAGNPETRTSAPSAAVTLTIDDDGPPPPPPSVDLSVADARAREGEPVTFTVRLEGAALSSALALAAMPSSGPDDTATAGTDYATAVQHVSIAAGQRSATFSVATMQDADVEPDETFTVALSARAGTSLPAGVTLGDAATATGTILDDDGPAPPSAGVHHLPLFVPAADALGRQSFARIVNDSDVAGEVRIDAFDDEGTPYGPLTLHLGAHEVAHFNSDDLESGNPARGLDGATGAGVGRWRLALTSDLDLEVLSYLRTRDGGLASMHDLVPRTEAGGHRVVFFNPASNTRRVSALRLINPGAEAAEVVIEGTDGAGASPGTAVSLSVPAGGARRVTAQALESADARGEALRDLSGALGDGAGKWRLVVRSDEALQVMSLVSGPDGSLNNLSTAPGATSTDDETTSGVHHLPLFVPTSDAFGRQSFARIVNDSDVAGEVRIDAFDDEGTHYGPLTLYLGAREAVQFNSHDLETGNPDHRLDGATGAGEGRWRLALTSDLDLEVLGYLRMSEGGVASMHDLAPRTEAGHRVVFFNPASAMRRFSALRLVNPGAEAAEVVIEGIDDTGASPGTAVHLSVPAQGARMVTARALESADGRGEDLRDLSGALGDGAGKWRLAVRSDEAIQVMSLVSSPAGHLNNVSTAPPPPP